MVSSQQSFAHHRSLRHYALLAALVMTVGAPTAASAQENRHVDANFGTNAGGNDCTNQVNPCRTIAYAVTQAVSGDALRLTKGFAFIEQNIVLDKDLIIAGTGGKATVNAIGNGRHFLIRPNTTVEMISMLLVNGAGVARGGSIFNEGNLTLENSRFRNNNASETGGAIHNEAGTVELKRTILENNSAGSGGAIANSGAIASIIVTESQLNSNNAETNGGAIFNEFSGNTISLFDTSLARNTALSDGGAVYNDNGIVAALEAEFKENDATTNGGAITNSGVDASITMIGGVFEDNVARSQGGAVSNELGAKIYLTNTDLDSNQAGNGGAVANDDGEVIVTGGLWTRNTASTFGGGLFSDGANGNVSFTGSLLSNNSAAIGGGILNASSLQFFSSSLDSNDADAGAGLYNQNGFATITQSTLQNNSAIGSGGGIYNRGGDEFLAEVHLINSTLTGNGALDQGGAIFNAGSVLADNATLFGNSAPNGSGIYNQQNSVELWNSIITASSIDDCLADSGVFTGNNNLIDDFNLGDCALISTASVTGIEPIAAGNGGATNNHALLTGSNAIDDGIDCMNHADDTLLGVDQRGMPRPAPVSIACDIGAFELQ